MILLILLRSDLCHVTAPSRVTNSCADWLFALLVSHTSLCAYTTAHLIRWASSPLGGVLSVGCSYSKQYGQHVPTLCSKATFYSLNKVQIALILVTCAAEYISKPARYIGVIWLWFEKIWMNCLVMCHCFSSVIFKDVFLKMSFFETFLLITFLFFNIYIWNFMR